MNAEDPSTQTPVRYPYMWAMGNAIFLLLAIGAVLDPEPQSIGPKVTGSLALLIVGIKQAQGLHQRWPSKVRVFTALFVLADVVLIALIWTIR